MAPPTDPRPMPRGELTPVSGQVTLSPWFLRECVPRGELLRLPDGVTLREAALTEPLSVALHGISQANVQPGERVLITGGGPIGALSAAALIHRGITDVVVSEPSPVRRDLCERLGATVVEPDTLRSPASPSSIVDHPFHVALECSGHAVA